MYRGTGRIGLVALIGGVAACLSLVAAPAGAAQGPEGATPSASSPTQSVASTSGAPAVALTTSTDDKPTTPADDAPKKAADDETSDIVDFLHSIQVDGFVDGYYLWSFNQTNPQLQNFAVNHNSISLNYTEVAVFRAPTDKSRAGFRLDLGAGDTADMVNAFEPGGVNYLKYVQQAYVSYLVPAGKGLSIDFGKFVTPAGAEVIESKDNWNYSRGLLFSWAIPYYHMGARIGYTLNDKVSLTGFVVNGWNDVKDNNSAKTVAGSVTVKPNGKLTVIGNYIVGKEQAAEADGGTRNLFDTVVTYAASPKLSVLGNFDYGHDKVSGAGVDWYGVAFGAKYQYNDKWAFIPRYEIFKDADGFSTGTTQTLQEFTLTGEYKTPVGLLARVEFRTDFSDEKFFVKDSSALSKTQPMVIVGLVYAFSSKK
jgi:hypothetical protein